MGKLCPIRLHLHVVRKYLLINDPMREVYMKTAKISLIGSCIAVASLSLVLLAGCNSNGMTGGVAATVNGTEISEDTITQYINDMRSSNGLTDDDSWAEYLSTYGETPESVRSDVIDYYVKLELEKQYANDSNISVSDDEVNSAISSMKSNYSTDEAWQSALSSAGLTEDKYKENVTNALLEQKVSDAVTKGKITPSKKKVLSTIKTYKSYFSGMKKSSQILFSSKDKKKAKKVLAQIKAGTISFEDAAKKYSTDSASAKNGGNVGWDKLNSFVTEYTDALDKLKKGQVSGLVTSDYGIHIIKCTDVWTAPKKLTSLDQVPDALTKYITSYLKNNNESTKFQEWYDDYKSQQDIKVNDMPSNVSYNVDMSKYSSSTSDETASSSSDSSSTDSSSTESSSVSSSSSALESSSSSSSSK